MLVISLLYSADELAMDKSVQLKEIVGLHIWKKNSSCNVKEHEQNLTTFLLPMCDVLLDNVIYSKFGWYAFHIVLHSEAVHAFTHTTMPSTISKHFNMLQVQNHAIHYQTSEFYALSHKPPNRHQSLKFYEPSYPSETWTPTSSFPCRLFRSSSEDIWWNVAMCTGAAMSSQTPCNRSQCCHFLPIF